MAKQSILTYVISFIYRKENPIWKTKCSAISVRRLPGKKAARYAAYAVKARKRPDCRIFSFMSQKGLSAVMTAMRASGIETDASADNMVIHNLFATITNASFDNDDLTERIKATLKQKKEIS